MTREELLKMNIYVPTRFSEQIELRLKLGQKVLFKYQWKPGQYMSVLISIGHFNAPYIVPDLAKTLQYQWNIRDIRMICNILTMIGWGKVSEYLIRPEDLDKFISYLHD